MTQKIKNHNFNKSYRKSYSVFTFGGKLRKEYDTHSYCSDCNITKSHYERLSKPERLEYYEERLSNLQDSENGIWGLTRSEKSDKKEYLKMVALIKIIEDCSMIKIMNKFDEPVSD